MAPRFKRPLIAVPPGSVDEQGLRRWMTQVSDSVNDLVRLIQEGRDDTDRVLRGDASWAEIEASAHGEQAGGDLHDTATTLVAGFMSAADKVALTDAVTDISGLASDISDLESDVSDLESDISDIEADISALDDRLVDVENGKGSEFWITFNGDPGIGNGQATSWSHNRTESMLQTTGYLVAPRAGTITLVYIELGDENPASGSMDVRLYINGSVVNTQSLTFPLTSATHNASMSVAVAAGDAIKIDGNKGSIAGAAFTSVMVSYVFVRS